MNINIHWQYAQTFAFARDETVLDRSTIVGKLDRYLLNADIAGFLSEYVFDNDISEIVNDTETMNNIFENEQTKTQWEESHRMLERSAAAVAAAKAAAMATSVEAAHCTSKSTVCPSCRPAWASVRAGEMMCWSSADSRP